jgi:hypothetical protein
MSRSYFGNRSSCQSADNSKEPSLHPEEPGRDQEESRNPECHREEPGEDSSRRAPLGLVSRRSGPRFAGTVLYGMSVCLTRSGHVDVGGFDVRRYERTIEQIFHLHLHRQNSCLDAHIADSLHFLIGGIQHAITDAVGRLRKDVTDQLLVLTKIGMHHFGGIVIHKLMRTW